MRYFLGKLLDELSEVMLPEFPSELLTEFLMELMKKFAGETPIETPCGNSREISKENLERIPGETSKGVPG